MPNVKHQNHQNRVESKRQRVAKACDYCRGKKVRCDGEHPCNNCISYKSTCTYNHVKKRRTTADKKSSPKRSKEIDDRLERLELMIESLVTQLGTSTTVEPSVSRIQQSLETTDDEQSDTTQNENDSLSSNPGCCLGTSTDKSSDSKTLNVCLPKQQPPFSSNGSTTCSDATFQFAHRKTQNLDSFYADYSSFSLFSKEGEEWLRSKIKSEHLRTINENLKLLVAKHVSYSFTQWIEPIQITDLQPFFSKEICIRLFEFLFSHSSDPMYPIDTAEQFDLLEAYCESQGKGKGKLHHLSYANLMMLNMFLVFALGLYREFVLKKNVVIEGLNISPEKTIEYENGYLRNTIFYYQRLFLVGDGVNSILAILLLFKYCEGTLAFHAAYMLLSTCVRLAQEMGLHRAESYVGLTEEEHDRRALIWWNCYAKDKLYCIKSGKPSIINDFDVSAPFPSFWQKLVIVPQKSDEFRRRIDEEYGPGLTIPEYIRINALNTIYTKGKAGVSHYYLSLGILVSYIYQTFFLANAADRSSLEEQMIQFEEISEKLEQWRLSLPEECRPKSQKELNTQENYKNLSAEGIERVLLEQTKMSSSNTRNPFKINGAVESLQVKILLKDLHLGYYTILSSVFKIFIDRTLKFVNAVHYDPKVVGEYIAIRVNSCREVLFLSEEVGEGSNLFIKIFSFYLLSAFIPVFCNILKNPDSETTAFDFALLNYSVNNFFDNLECPHPVEPKGSRHPLTLLTLFFLLVAHNTAKESSQFASISIKFDELQNKNFELFETIGLTDSQSKIFGDTPKPVCSLIAPATRGDFQDQDLTTKVAIKQDDKLLSDSMNTYTSGDTYLHTYAKESLNRHNLYRTPNFASQIVPPILPNDIMMHNDSANLADANFPCIRTIDNPNENSFIPIDYHTQPNDSENSKIVTDLAHEQYLEDVNERANLFQTVFDVPGFYLDS